MASRTQIRLEQLTGSAVDFKTESQQYIAQSTAGTLTGSDVRDLFGMIGGALLRIHGASSDEPFNSAEGTFATSVFDVNASGAVTVDSSGGTISIGADNVNQNINIGTDGQREITIGDASAANSAGLTLRANTGGIDIDCSQGTGALSLDTAGGDIEIGVNAAAGAINIGTNATQRKITIGSATGNTEVEIATGTGGVDVDSTGKINIATSNANADALTIDVSGNGGADITIGNAANDANANLDIVVMNKLNIDVQGTDAADGVEITLGGDNADAKVIIQNNSGNDALTVDGLLDVSVGRNLTVAGNLDVNGTTTTIDTTNLSVEDSIIALGVSGSNGGYSLTGDRGILFPRGAVGSKVHGFFLKGADGQFQLGQSTTGPTSGSFSAVSAGDFSTLKLGNLLPGADDTYDLGSTALAWQDLHMEGDVLMTDAGKVETAAGDLTLSSAAADVVIDSAADITLDAATEKIALKKAGTEVGSIIMDANDGQGLIVSSSLNQSLTLDSNQGFIVLGQSTLDGGSNGAAFVLGGNSIQIETPSYDPGGGHTAFKFVHNDTYGSQFLQVSGSLRLYKENAGDRYVAIDVNNPGTNYNLTLPDAVPSTNNEILISDTSGNLSFATQAELGIGSAASKGVKVITSTVNAGTAVNFNAVDAGDTISGLSQASSQGASVDLYVNGQLLVSGSAAERSAGTRDYDIEATGTTVKFAFDLEADDVVQLIKR